MSFGGCRWALASRSLTHTLESNFFSRLVDSLARRGQNRTAKVCFGKPTPNWVKTTQGCIFFSRLNSTNSSPCLFLSLHSSCLPARVSRKGVGVSATRVLHHAGFVLLSRSSLEELERNSKGQKTGLTRNKELRGRMCVLWWFFGETLLGGKGAL